MTERARTLLVLIDFLVDLAGLFSASVQQGINTAIVSAGKQSEAFCARLQRETREVGSAAVSFEVRAYFIHMVDAELFTSTQAPPVRPLVMKILYRVTGRDFAESLATTEGELIQVLQQRLQAYGEVVSSKGGADYLKNAHWLLSHYVRAAMASGRVAAVPPPQLDAILDFYVQSGLLETATHLELPFRAAVHDLFKGNRDFTRLRPDEVTRRLSSRFSRYVDAVRARDLEGNNDKP